MKQNRYRITHCPLASDRLQKYILSLFHELGCKIVEIFNVRFHKRRVSIADIFMALINYSDASVPWDIHGKW